MEQKPSYDLVLQARRRISLEDSCGTKQLNYLDTPRSAFVKRPNFPKTVIEVIADLCQEKDLYIIVEK